METKPTPAPAPENLPDDLIGLHEAAKLANVHWSTVHRWVNQFTLRGWRRGGRILVSRADVLAMFQPIKPAS